MLGFSEACLRGRQYFSILVLGGRVLGVSQSPVVPAFFVASVFTLLDVTAAVLSLNNHQQKKLAEGNNSGEAKAAAAAMKASDASGSKGKAKSGSGAVGGGGKGNKKSGRTSAPAESLSELALACFEECVCIAAHCSPRARAGASRTGKVLAVSHSPTIVYLSRCFAFSSVFFLCPTRICTPPPGI